MALTAPTPPTAPAPPVVPGARQSSSQDGNAGQEAGNGASAAAEMGRGFGVHITINPPGQADSGKGGGQENTVVQTVPSGQQAGAEQGKAAERPASAQDSDAAAAEVAQQARQAAVQQMLGEDEGSQQALIWTWWRISLRIRWLRVFGVCPNITILRVIPIPTRRLTALRI